MSWVRATVKTVHLLGLLLVCVVTLYSVVSQDPILGLGDEQEQKTQALTIVESEELNQNDSVVVVEMDDEILIENDEPFIATNEWKRVKPGQAIPKGLHVRMNVKTGENEARLLQEEDKDPQNKKTHADIQNEHSHLHDQYTLDELKRAVKELKSEKFEFHDMQTLRDKHNYRSYEELKEDMKSMEADFKTDAEILTGLVQHFLTLSPTSEDVKPVLIQLEYYLHQIDNALLFCDLGAMPTLLKCLNNSLEEVRSEAALTLGSALQSNPKVQVSALDNGAMHEILKILAADPSPKVRKHAMYALSTMIRQFPFAQKRFLEQGGLSVLAKLFEDSTAEKLQVRAVTLLADLVKEKNKHMEHLNAEDSTQKERIRQYDEVALPEAMVQTGWCSLIPTLLRVQEHGGREHVLVAMDTVLPACRSDFYKYRSTLQKLRKEYVGLLAEELERDEGEEDGFYQTMVNTIDSVLVGLQSASPSSKDEL